jgi:hypothetical protein
MPLSYVTAAGTNTANQLVSYSAIDLFVDIPHKDQLVVSLNDQSLTIIDDYTLDTTNKQVTILDPSSGTIKVARTTEIEDRLVNFTNTSILTQQDMNKNTDQLLFLIQELDDTVNDLTLATAGSIQDNSVTAAKLRKVSGEEAVTTETIRLNAVTTDKILNSAVTTDKIADDAVTYQKLSAGGPEWDATGNVTATGDMIVDVNLDVTGNATVGGTLDVTGTVTADGIAEVGGDLKFNSGYGSAIVGYGCRAWATLSAVQKTGTYSRNTSGVITVTSTSHGFTAGNVVYLDFASGATDNTFTILTVPNANTFTVNDGTTAAITGPVNVNINVTTIHGSGNISAAPMTANGVFDLTFTNAMVDANYAITATAQNNAAGTELFASVNAVPTTTGFTVAVCSENGTAVIPTTAGTNYGRLHVAVFR